MSNGTRPTEALFVPTLVTPLNCEEIVMTQPDVDPVIDEIREARRRISEHVDHSPTRLVDYCIRIQDQYR